MADKKNKPAPKKAVQAVPWWENERLFPWLPIGIYFVLVIMLFAKFVFSNQMLAGSDTLQAGIFFRSYLVEFVKNYGHAPQWNPYIFGGMPFVDAFHGDIFYPLSFLKFLMSLDRALGWIQILHIFLAGCFMYACARRFGTNFLGAFTSGLFYMLSTYLVSLVSPGHDGKIFVTALFPLALLFMEATLREKPFLNSILMGGVLGLIWLTPHPQMAYFTHLALAFYAAYSMIEKIWTEKTWAWALIRSAAIALGVVIGLGISAIQMWPGINYVNNYSPRAEERGYEWATSWSMHTEELVGQLIGGFSGMMTQAEQSYWGRNPFKDNSEYTGLVCLLLALTGVVLWKERKKWFFVGLALFALIYALGATTPLFKIFYYLIPQVKKMRAPSMIMFLFSFSGALLAGFGLELLAARLNDVNEKLRKRLFVTLGTVVGLILLLTFLMTFTGKGFAGFWKGIFYTDMPPFKDSIFQANSSKIAGRAWLALFIGGVTFGLIWLYIKRSVTATVLVAALLTIGAFDLFRLDKTFIDTTDLAAHFSPHPLVNAVKSDLSPGRIFVPPQSMTGVSLFGTEDYLPYFEIESITGYHGNQLRWYEDFIGGKPFANLGNLNFLNLLNTRYIVSRDSFVMPGVLEMGSNYGGIYLYRNLSALPRAFAVFNYRLAKNAAEIVEQIRPLSFNPSRTIFFTEDPAPPGWQPDTLTAPIAAEITDRQVESYKTTVNLPRPGFLFLSENFYPNWRAFENGKELKVYQANITFRAVYLPSGSHTVEWRYIPTLYSKARAITWAFSLLVLLAVGFSLFLSRRKASTQTETPTPS